MDLGLLKKKDEILTLGDVQAKLPYATTGPYVSTLLPLYRSSGPFYCGQMKIVTGLWFLKPPINCELKWAVENVQPFLGQMKLMYCKKLAPFMLVNVYKTRVIADVLYRLGVETKPKEVFKCIYDGLFDPATQLFRRFRQPLTLLDVYVLMDTLECNVIIYNKLQYVSYLRNIQFAWLIFKYENVYDLTYMGIYDQIRDIMGYNRLS
jgi:hypothetical protein